MAGGEYPGFPPDDRMRWRHRLIQRHESYLAKQLLGVVALLLVVLGCLVAAVVLLGDMP